MRKGPPYPAVPKPTPAGEKRVVKKWSRAFLVQNAARVLKESVHNAAKGFQVNA